MHPLPRLYIVIDMFARGFGSEAKGEANYGVMRCSRWPRCKCKAILMERSLEDLVEMHPGHLLRLPAVKSFVKKSFPMLAMGMNAPRRLDRYAAPEVQNRALGTFGAHSIEKRY